MLLKENFLLSYMYVYVTYINLLYIHILFIEMIHRRILKIELNSFFNEKFTRYNVLKLKRRAK